MNDQTCGKALDRQTGRLLKLLAKKPDTGLRGGLCNDRYMLKHGDRVFQFPAAIINTARRRKLIQKSGSTLRISDQGNLELGIWLDPERETGSPGVAFEEIDLKVAGAIQSVKFNPGESPLARLFKRPTSEGKSYITADEFQAGEKLRTDFEQGQLQQSVTASWHATPVNNRHRGSGSNEISDFAMDARDRVSRAIDFLGPELSGVALDVCCFMKGLERVELERRWPPRSAKLMLRTGLAMLSRHYGLSQTAAGGKRKIQQWGTGDYRPHMRGT